MTGQTQKIGEYLDFEEIKPSPLPTARNSASLPAKTSRTAILAKHLAQIPIPTKKDTAMLVFGGLGAILKIIIWSCYWSVFVFVKIAQILEAALRPKKRAAIIKEYDAPPPNAPSDWRPSNGSGINVNVNVNINQTS